MPERNKRVTLLPYTHPERAPLLGARETYWKLSSVPLKDLPCPWQLLCRKLHTISHKPLSSLHTHGAVLTGRSYHNME